MVMSTLLISLSTRRQSNSANVPAAAEMGNPLKLNKEEWLGFTGMLRGDAIESVAAAGDRVGRYFNRNNGSALIAPLQHRLASLVNAQLPSVCFVNAGVLWSEDSEAQTYKFPWRANDRPRNTAQFADHAVLVAGVSTDRNRFCLNDPSKYPFTIYSKRHLFEAMVNGEFCVVYPPEVRVGLYQGMYSAKGSKPIFELGISEISDIAEKVSPSESARRASTMAGFSDKEYCLGRITLKPELHLELPNGDTIGLADFKRMGLESLARHSGRLSGKISGHWVWIEVRKSVDCITVWSAEQPASGLKRERLASIADPGWLLSTFRLAVLRKSTRTGEWTVKNNERLRDDAMKLDAAAADVSSMRRSASHVARSPFSELPPAKNFPEISLISSFAANGLATAVANWPRRHVDNCEMYAFMRPDATLIHSGKDCPPIQWMNLPDRRQQKRMAVRIADSIELIEKQHGYMPRIRAFATHFPEVARAVPDMSVNSLSTLVELARTLRDRRHSVSTIEVVAGSRILGLQPYRRPPKRGEPQEIICVAKVVPRPVDSGRVPSILSAIAEVVKFTELSASERLTFSIELEPGRYYELNDLQGICHLISAIDQHPLAKMLKPIVGLSVDIGHYAIAGILPSQLLGSKMDRVVHFHLSDHRGGHFVDLPIGDGGLGSQRGKAAFDPWLKFIYECYTTARADELPPLSGLVSLEMEAATSIVGLENSLKLMRKWFH
jgi:sugar phosphate isomerase/epimerase